MTKTTLNAFDTVNDESIHIVLCDGDAIARSTDASLIFSECHRVLKPGGFLFAFASPQTFHKVAMMIEESKSLGEFEMRDAITWMHKTCDVPNHNLPARSSLISLAQKAKMGTFVDNWEIHRVGLIDTNVKWEGKFPSNVVSGDENERVEVAAHLLRVFGCYGCEVLDPWMISEDFHCASTEVGALFTGLTPFSVQTKAA